VWWRASVRASSGPVPDPELSGSEGAGRADRKPGYNGLLPYRDRER